MSVINQMLRDLDARHASEQERAGLPPRLRTLPPVPLARSAEWRLLAVGMAAGALMTGLAASWYFAVPTVPVAPAAAVPVATPAAPAPASAAPALPVAAEVLPDIATAIAPAPLDTAEMKLSTLLAKSQPEPATEKPSAPPAAAKPLAPAPPRKAPEPGPAQTPAKPVAEAAKRAPEPREAKPAPLPTLAAAAPAGAAGSDDGQIDKRTTGGQGRELAENEYRKGMQAVKRGDTAAAHPLFQRALELDPALAKARQALLSVLVGARQWAEARQVARHGLALDPAQTAWATILARLQFEQGDAAAAIETLARHAAHAGGDADYQGLHAYLLQKQQRPAEAVERFQAALALRPNEGRWWFGLGLALEAAGRGADAREAYSKAQGAGNLPADMLAVVEQKLR